MTSSNFSTPSFQKKDDSIQIVIKDSPSTNNKDNNDNNDNNGNNDDKNSFDSKDSSFISNNSGPIVKEPDTLLEQDIKTIKPYISDHEELTRLFRAVYGLTRIQVRIVEIRYLKLLNKYKNRLIYIDFFHHFSRSYISIGSIAVPALLSIQSPTSNHSVWLFWMTWVISLSVTCLHNFVTIFRFEKKYFGLHTTYEKLKSEGWHYLQLSGRYTGRHGHPEDPAPSIQPTHQNQFILFVHTIERVEHKQIVDEYNGFKGPEKPLIPGMIGSSGLVGSPGVQNRVGQSNVVEPAPNYPLSASSR